MKQKQTTRRVPCARSKAKPKRRCLLKTVGPPKFWSTNGERQSSSTGCTNLSVSSTRTATSWKLNVLPLKAQVCGLRKFGGRHFGRRGGGRYRTRSRK